MALDEQNTDSEAKVMRADHPDLSESGMSHDLA
jgi:hypothetical protein